MILEVIISKEIENEKKSSKELKNILKQIQITVFASPKL